MTLQTEADVLDAQAELATRLYAYQYFGPARWKRAFENGQGNGSMRAIVAAFRAGWLNRHRLTSGTDDPVFVPAEILSSRS